jgi:hypothetical protein
VSARASIAGFVLAAALAGGAVAAQAKTTKEFSFQSKGTAINHAATNGSDDPTTYEDHPFTIGPNDRDGTINVHVGWLNPADDWDLYVYRKGPGGKLFTVAQSAGGPPNTEENAVGDSQGIPMKPGGYVIRVVNYAAAVPNYTGTAKFGPFTPYNQIPVAKLSAPKQVKKGKVVKLDASKSHDPDGTIKSYAFDLDGNGSMEVKNGSNPVLKRVLSPGVHHVAVRVIDNSGLRSFANRTVTVGN